MTFVQVQSSENNARFSINGQNLQMQTDN